MINVRGYGQADLPELERLRAALGTDSDTGDGRWLPGPVPANPGDPDGRCQLGYLDGELVGYGWVDWWTEVDGTHLFLLWGCVEPAARGRGVGTALLAAQQERALRIAGRLGMAAGHLRRQRRRRPARQRTTVAGQRFPARLHGGDDGLHGAADRTCPGPAGRPGTAADGRWTSTRRCTPRSRRRSSPAGWGTWSAASPGTWPMSRARTPGSTCGAWRGTGRKWPAWRSTRCSRTAPGRRPGSPSARAGNAGASRWR